MLTTWSCKLPSLLTSLCKLRFFPRPSFTYSFQTAPWNPCGYRVHPSVGKINGEEEEGWALPHSTTTLPHLPTGAVPLLSGLGVGFHRRFRSNTGLRCYNTFENHCLIPCSCLFSLPCHPEGYIICILKFHHLVFIQYLFPWEFKMFPRS